MNLINWKIIQLSILILKTVRVCYNITILCIQRPRGRDGEVDTQIVLLWRQFFLERKLNSVTVNLIHPLKTLEVRKI